MMMTVELNSENTLDPPGRIAVIGAGPLGIEAALYGRFLGYEVTVFESHQIGYSLRQSIDAPLPMLPDRCLSPLAVSALKAHDGGIVTAGDVTLPTTTAAWVRDGLQRLVDTDLLRDRVRCDHRVVAIKPCDVDMDSGATDGYAEHDEADNAENPEGDFYVDGDVPPDYVVAVEHDGDVTDHTFECVIIAIGTGDAAAIDGLGNLDGAAYLFRIGSTRGDDDEATLHRGWHDIVDVFAQLGGRPGLDMYRPARR